MHESASRPSMQLRRMPIKQVTVIAGGGCVLPARRLPPPPLWVPVARATATLSATWILLFAPLSGWICHLISSNLSSWRQDGRRIQSQCHLKSKCGRNNDKSEKTAANRCKGVQGDCVPLGDRPKGGVYKPKSEVNQNGLSE